MNELTETVYYIMILFLLFGLRGAFYEITILSHLINRFMSANLIGYYVFVKVLMVYLEQFRTSLIE